MLMQLTNETVGGAVSSLAKILQETVNTSGKDNVEQNSEVLKQTSQYISQVAEFYQNNTVEIEIEVNYT